MTEKKNDTEEVPEGTIQANLPDLDLTEIPDELPILPVRNTVLYPSMVLPLMVARGRSVKLVDNVLTGNRLLGVVAQRDPAIEDPEPKDLYQYGSAGIILKMLKFPDESIRVLVRGMRRIQIKEILGKEPYFRAKVDVLESRLDPSVKVEALVQNIRQQFSKLIESSPILPR